MTETDTIDPELEERARELFAAAVSDVRPSAGLDGRVHAAIATPRSGSALRWYAAVAAFALLAGGAWIVLAGDDASNVDVRDEPIAPVAGAWWSKVGATWTDLPAPPSTAIRRPVTATAESLDLWLQSSTPAEWAVPARFDGSEWVRRSRAGRVAPWTSAIPSRDDDRTFLVAVRALLAGPETSFGVFRLPISESGNIDTTAEQWTALGESPPVDSYLGPVPVLLPVPADAGGGVALLSHENGAATGRLVVERVGARREPLGMIPASNQRPLAVGASPDGEPVVLTQAIDPPRLPSMLIAWALTADGTWRARGSATFGEADARWVGDRFVVVTNQHDQPRGSAAVELVLGPVGSDTSWKALADPGIGSCEGPIELVSDEQGGVVATSCNRSAYLAPGESKWKPVPASDDGWNIPLAMWDGRLVAQVSEGSGADPPARLRAIDLRADR